MAALFLLQARQAARGVTVITDTYPGAVQKYLRQPGIICELAPSALMELLQEGAMYTPANGEVRAQARCSRWHALHLHPCSRSCGSRAGNLCDPIFDDRFLKALAKPGS